jgi:hypothetical protein
MKSRSEYHPEDEQDFVLLWLLMNGILRRNTDCPDPAGTVDIETDG